jgi:cell division protein FtsL
VVTWLSRHRRRVLDVLITAALTAVLVLAGVVVYGKVQQYESYRAALDATVRVINHNLQQGKLDLPPELRPQPAATPAASEPKK